MMHVLGIPTYVALVASMWTFPYGKPFGGILVATLGALLYQLLYSKSLYLFVHKLRPQRPVWQFVLTVILVQLFALAVLYAAA